MIAYTTISTRRFGDRVSRRSQTPTQHGESPRLAGVGDMFIEAAKLPEPAFEKYNGRNGRLSVQTDPRFHRDAKKLADQAVEFSEMAKNIVVKVPATKTVLRPLRTPPTGASTTVTVIPCRRQWRLVKRLSVASSAARPKARTSPRWARL